MTGRKPTPLKDEKADPIEELQEQVAELIVAVNSLVEKVTATGELQADGHFQNSVASAVVKAVQDLLEARQRKFEEADKGKMTVNEVLQEILGHDRFKHIDENLQKVCGNEKLLYDMMKSFLQAQNIKAVDECKRPPMPSGFKARVRHFACSLPLYWLKRVYRSSHVRLYVKICLFCIWVITIATAAFIAYDNAVLRKENAAIIQLQRDTN